MLTGRPCAVRIVSWHGFGRFRPALNRGPAIGDRAQRTPRQPVIWPVEAPGCRIVQRRTGFAMLDQPRRGRTPCGSLDLRRGLSGARDRCRPGPAGRDHRGRAAAPRRADPGHRAGRPRDHHPRSGRLAHCQAPRLARGRIALLPPAPQPGTQRHRTRLAPPQGAYLSHRIFPDAEAIIDACREAWNTLIAEPGRIRSLTASPWVLRVRP
jgi:hypothetical protein